MSKFSTWYALHRKEFNSKRKKRYRRDPEYRANILEQNKNYREQNREQNNISFKKEIFIDALEPTIPMYTIGLLASLLHCTPQAIRNWEKENIIFETPFRDDTDQRLYTEEMVDIIVKIMLEQGRVVSSARQTKSNSLTFLCVNRDINLLEPICFFYRSELLKNINKTANTIRKLEDDGEIPISPYIDPRNNTFFLYTKEMIDIVTEVLNSVPITNFTIHYKKKFYFSIEKEWNKLPKYDLLYLYKD